MIVNSISGKEETEADYNEWNHKSGNECLVAKLRTYHLD